MPIISHGSYGVNDLNEAGKFYTGVLGILGAKVTSKSPRAVFLPTMMVQHAQ